MSFGWVTLVPTPKSHPFEERRIKVTTQNEPVKIGRAVARTQATSDNAVFDCKVLSRNHAILWYRDGEFWLKDTKSSNGTFVNNEKLQIDQKATGRETDSRRVYSGDIIQFGVEIVENANKVSVVYGCIYAVLQCFNAEGRFFENTSPAAEEGVRSTGTLVSNRKLFQMQQYVLEAQHR
uniref:FHA domain-containing protein n=1 Tax=Caenorhabditis japonica TaxID=281687 RepID=A0A8R1EB68_CAEJA